jgi:N-acetylornithine carbamoyltransferase
MTQPHRFLSLADLPGDALARVLDLATRTKRGDYDRAAAAGKRVALLFFNPSLRTRMSMELAAQSIGAHTVAVVPGADAWKLETRPGAVMDGDTQEHLVDAVRVMAEMSDLIAVRTFAGLKDAGDDRKEPVLSAVARESRVPVVNMESAFDHPLQALADLMTMQEEFGRDLRGVPVTLTWAPHPRALPMAVPAAFLRGCARMGMDVRVAAPKEFMLPDWLLAEAAAAHPERRIRVTEDQSKAFEGTRAVYAKAWGSPLHYADSDAGLAARRQHRDWTTTEQKLALGDRAIFLHCLPVRRNVVVTDEVLDGPRCRVYQEAGNRLHTARAVLMTLLGGNGK